jgi:hypothetical protein
MNTARKIFSNEDLYNSLKTHFFVDIGASNDVQESQTEFLLDKGWKGLMFEADEQKFAGLLKRLSIFPCEIINSKITPDNILALLEENNTPENFYLSLDVDSYDYYILQKILTKYTPQLIISEINEKIPPPIKFSVSYKENISWDGTHFYGYSICMLEDVLNKYGYKILSLDYNNVVLIPGKQKEEISYIYERGYYNTKDRKQRFYYNENFEEIFSMTIEDQINFINNYFSNYKQNYIISV